MDMEVLTDIAIRTAAVYLAIVIGLLLIGRKELSQMSVTDLVMLLLLSNSVQNAMVGSDVSLEGGITAALVLMLMNLIFRKLTYRSPVFRKVLEGEPVVLIYNGEIQERNLRRQGITRDELMAVIREHGVSEIGEVSLSMLEIDGNISVISEALRGSTKHKRKRKTRGFFRQS